MNGNKIIGLLDSFVFPTLSNGRDSSPAKIRISKVGNPI